MAEDSQTISFRVPASVANQLEAGGRKETLSRNEYARKLVLAALAAPSLQELFAETQETKRLVMATAVIQSKSRNGDGNEAQLTAALGRIIEELSKLRLATASGIAAVLVQAGSVQPNEAEAWVRQNML